ncbi:PREDICTED: acid-sensing ion channel 1-like [Priapulus caudatus]|uniref:Acid-sensing ion channel 1-like n=1 Tax=Priapulus caudatus TaxID=37621 RepID=A0ABM1EVL3_PRICU|nr:PREDICTED: acid-sensing ion channel 1-like [Priapulus caudatus]
MATWTKRARRSISACSRQTTLHCVHWAFDSRIPLLLRLGWIIAILSAWSYMFYLTYKRVTYLSSQPMKTIIDEQFSARGLEFPGVTICNNNLVKRSAARQLKEYAELERFLSDYADFTWRYGARAAVNFSTSGYKLAHVTPNDLYRLGRRDSAAAILRCSYGGENYRNHLQLMTRSHGNCFTFNSQEFKLSHDTIDPGCPG